MNTTLTLKIISLNSTGQGVGSDEGFKYFIDDVLPEEVVEVTVIEKKKNYGIARVNKILIASPERAQPICPIFEQCGGCQLMHVAYQSQLKFKRQRVVDAMKRIAHLDISVDECVPSPQIFNYRNKIQLPIFNSLEGLEVGLYKKNTHLPIALDRCYIHSSKGEAILASVKQKLRTSGLTLFSEELPKGTLRHLLIKTSQFLDESLLIFITTGRQTDLLKKIAAEIVDEHPEIKGVVENVNKDPTNTILSNQFNTLVGRDFIYEELGSKTFKISASAFFQINPFQMLALYSKALDLASLNAESRVLDAYCGVGTLALFAADTAKEVVGTEIVASAIEDARTNAKLNNALNCHFHCIKAENWLLKDSKFDCILLNPPRKGCEASVIESIAKQKVKTIIYISCDPETLARDLGLFVQRGYEVQSVSPFDMFPQTMHVESVVKIVKKEVKSL